MQEMQENDSNEINQQLVICQTWKSSNTAVHSHHALPNFKPRWRCALKQDNMDVVLKVCVCVYVCAYVSVYMYIDIN